MGGVIDGGGPVSAEPGAEHLVGVPDEFQRLWTPHRMAYIRGGQQPAKEDCPFCAAPTMADEESLVVHRGERCFVVMNLYPYNTGHLLVCPIRHVAMYDEATPAEVAEMAALTQASMAALREAAGAQGFNIGMNQGQLAGAGIAGHLHQHVVPRWAHDSNFLPIIAKTKALPRLLGEMRDAISAAWPTDQAPGGADTDE